MQQWEKLRDQSHLFQNAASVEPDIPMKRQLARQAALLACLAEQLEKEAAAGFRRLQPATP